MAASLSASDCAPLIESGLLPSALLREVVTRALRRRVKAPSGPRRRLSDAVRGSVVVPGYEDPLDAPLRDLVYATIDAVPGSSALLKALLRVWASSDEPLRDAVRTYLVEHGTLSVRSEGALRAAAELLVADHPEWRKDEATLMLAWEAGWAPGLPEGAEGDVEPPAAHAAPAPPPPEPEPRPAPGPERRDEPPGAQPAEPATALAREGRSPPPDAPTSRPAPDAMPGQQAWSVRFAATLGHLQALNPDHPAWADVDWFVPALQSLRRAKLAAPDSLARLEGALEALSRESADGLSYFGLPPLDPRRAADAPIDTRASLADAAAWLARMMRHHRLLRSRDLASLGDELARRRRLEALEAQILQTYEHLNAALSAPPEGGELAPERPRPPPSAPERPPPPPATPRAEPEPPPAAAEPSPEAEPRLEPEPEPGPVRSTPGVADEGGSAQRPPAPASGTPRPAPEGPAPTPPRGAPPAPEEEQTQREGTVSGKPPYAPRWEPLERDDEAPRRAAPRHSGPLGILQALLLRIAAIVGISH